MRKDRKMKACDSDNNNEMAYNQKRKAPGAKCTTHHLLVNWPSFFTSWQWQNPDSGNFHKKRVKVGDLVYGQEQEVNSGTSAGTVYGNVVTAPCKALLLVGKGGLLSIGSQGQRSSMSAWDNHRSRASKNFLCNTSTSKCMQILWVISCRLCKKHIPPYSISIGFLNIRSCLREKVGDMSYNYLYVNRVELSRSQQTMRNVSKWMEPATPG